MRHFDFLSPETRGRLFFREPREFGSDDSRDLLAAALGATLYSPATRPTLAVDIAKNFAHGVVGAVVCLEDAVADDDLPAAELNVVDQLTELARGGSARPLLFVRVRAARQIPMLVDRLGEHAGVLTGFVLPKFTAASGAQFLDAMVAAESASGHRLLAMPVLETPDVIYAEQRIDALLSVRALLDRHRDRILAVRIGATDLSSAFGLRRPRDLTVYDVRMVADAIGDIVNILGRPGPTGYPVTGPVWEYFTGTERLFKPQLRQSPFTEHAANALRDELITRDLDGLIREVHLDRANGLTGKTVIHPMHVATVHALSVVTHEEFADATDVLGTGGSGGAHASSYRNKMNESKPHTAWARRTMVRAHVFGVAHADVSFVDLLGAGLHR
ncbi:HpcH/HpaI aldolase/citrate lyase family protein [Rhodococcus sp. D2-41]|uniref:HpcH/HpaI aldolase/citrate lyase family protein n=1 Tax=Speluncibacter jeojiensis TaxID=2710754 RepID=UPI00240FD573|nr:HpcH/HpaI aldolase/citrate lyase family protein [Rhodococcus sp. D2-41]MDG3011964.1 HpcH/HpaI aldolase/citrate lyase family protein [Rhodococcus sp. D2-41]